MPEKLPVVSGKETIQVHVVLKKGYRVFTVPLHSTLKKGTLRKILKGRHFC